MEKNWDVQKAEELMIALQACESLEQLKELGKGIAFLPSSVLSEGSRAWLRDIYTSCKNALSEGPADLTKVLNKEGLKYHANLLLRKEKDDSSAGESSEKVLSVGEDERGKEIRLPRVEEDNKRKDAKGMRGKVMSVKKGVAGAVNSFTYVFFKMDDGSSAKTCLVQSYGNYKRWVPVLEKFDNGEEVWVGGVVLLRGKKGSIDADSHFWIIKEVEKC